MLRWRIDVTVMSRLVAWGTAIVVVAANVVRVAAQAQEKFVPMSDIGKETLPASPLVYTAYAFVWVALIVYVFSLWRRLTRVERDLAEVTARARR